VTTPAPKPVVKAPAPAVKVKAPVPIMDEKKLDEQAKAIALANIEAK
jgi:hypothetical protein